MSEAIIRSAFELRARDIRARQLADFAVAAAVDQVQKEPRYDPHTKPEAYAHDVAALATTILIERIYTDDRELAELRSLIEQLTDRSLKFLNASTPAVVAVSASVSELEGAIAGELRRQADVDENGVLYVSDDHYVDPHSGGKVVTIDGDVNMTKLAAAAADRTTLLGAKP